MGFAVDRIVRGFCWMFAVGAMGAGMAFILSKALPRRPNKASRFVVSFLLGVPFGTVYLYSKGWLLGYTDKMSWTEAMIVGVPGALLGAILLAFFWPPLSRNSNTQ